MVAATKGRKAKIQQAKGGPTGPFPADAKRATKRDFMQHRLDWTPVLALGHPCEWIGAELYITLDDTRRAIVSVDTTGTHEHYDRIRVKVVSKMTGPIDDRSFGFRAFLGGVRRADSRVSGQHAWPESSPALQHLNQTNVRYEVINHCGWDWYIAIPATTLPLTEAVAAYVLTFA